jgi:molybdopterin-containing oxidoreductase family membrane subunit
MHHQDRLVNVSTAEPLVREGNTYASATSKISGVILETKTPKAWFAAMGVGFMLLMVLLVAVSYLFAKGTGIWGINIPVGWGFAIVNFVWWIGIGHAGTLISAILLLLHQHWRNAINRFAEAMTLFAVSCAGLFPILHLGRPWLFYWLFPFPNPMGTWPQFRSPLVWDVFAVSTYATISFLFWYVGLIPDLATMRDKAKNVVLKKVYGIMSFGWRGASRHWHRYETAYILLAGLSTPLVVSVHSIVSFDFSVGIIPGWHATIFPPYFVAGAIYSGFAMVLTLVIPVRKMYHLEDFITNRHLDYMAKVMLSTGLIVAYGYLMEVFFAWYSGNPYERFMMANRAFGPYAPIYWLLILCNVALPQLLWLKKVRSSMLSLFAMSIIVNIGMWLERFVIVVTSLHRDFLPSSWGMYYPTIWDFATYAGTLGLFITLMFLFVRVLPMISIFEIRQLIPWPTKNTTR